MVMYIPDDHKDSQIATDFAVYICSMLTVNGRVPVKDTSFFISDMYTTTLLSSLALVWAGTTHAGIMRIRQDPDPTNIVKVTSTNDHWYAFHCRGFGREVDVN